MVKPLLREDNATHLPFGFSLARKIENNVISENKKKDEYIGKINCSPNGSYIAVATFSGKINILDTQTEAQLFSLNGHTSVVNHLVWSPDSNILASSGNDKNINIWDIKTGNRLKTLRLHNNPLDLLDWSPDGNYLISASSDTRLVYWIPTTGFNKQKRKHSFHSKCARWSPNGQLIVAATYNNDIFLIDSQWDTLSKRLTNFSSNVNCIAWCDKEKIIAVGLSNKTVEIWNIQTKKKIQVLEGHTSEIAEIHISYDGSFLATLAVDESMRIWRTDIWETVAVVELPRYAVTSSGYFDRVLRSAIDFHPQKLMLISTIAGYPTIYLWNLDPEVLLAGGTKFRTTHYSNAKVVLTGESGVGKSGLCLVLTGHDFSPTESTHARNITTLSNEQIHLEDGRTETREIILWDLAGQPGYRVFHRQHLDDAAVGLVLFDSRNEINPLAGIKFWSNALSDARHGSPLKKLLIISRIDRGGPEVSDERLIEACEENDFDDYCETSSKRGDGVTKLKEMILSMIDWDTISKVSTPEIFFQMKMFLVSEKKSGRVLHRRNELLHRFRQTEAGCNATDEILDTCVERLDAAGLLKPLSFGDFILLQPELLDAYSAWLAQAAHKEPDGLGFIHESDARKGCFPMDLDRSLKGTSDEELLLMATIEDLLARGIALRQSTIKGNMIVFPSELRTDMKPHPAMFNRQVRYLFEGPLKAIYATLSVYLTHSPTFKKERFYCNAATYHSLDEGLCGFSMDYPDQKNETLGRITVFFDNEVKRTTKITFLSYVYNHIERLAFKSKLERERIYECGCTYEIPTVTIDECKRQKRGSVFCPMCGEKHELDEMTGNKNIEDIGFDTELQRSSEEIERQKRLTVMEYRDSYKEYHVFLCHNSKDKPDIRILSKRLREFGIVPWLDEDGILAGEQFVAEIEKIIDQVPAVAIIFGQNWLGKWQEQEYYAIIDEYVKRKQMDHKKKLRLIPVFLQECSEDHDAKLPMFLKGFQKIDFRVTEKLNNSEDTEKHQEKLMRRLVEAIVS